MAIDTAANFIYSAVATAPSPATSGTSLVMTDDLSAIMSAVPFNAFIWPTTVGPLSGNAEIVRVTGISGATLTITRAQEGTVARTVVVGDQIAAGPTAKFRDDVVVAIAGKQAARAVLDKVYLRGADVASASTIDLDAATGDFVNVTGTTGITAITLANGVERVLQFSGILTVSGINIVAPSGSITTASGDYAIVRGDAAGIVRFVAYTRANGKPLTAPAVGDITGLGTGVATALALADDGTSSSAIGFRGIPQTSVSASRTVAAADNGTHWYHPSADTTSRAWTIDSNANLPLPIGFTLTFINDASAGLIVVAITSDTLVFAGSGATGSRSLAANGIATVIKITATRWQINGSGLT